MFILGIDTSADIISAAVLENEKTLVQKNAGRGTSSSDILYPLVEDCIFAAGLADKKVDLIAVVSGPGSFTGLRIGISFIKGFSAGVETPVFPVSSLETIAEVSGIQEAPVRPVIDARRDQVFTGLYQMTAGVDCCIETDQILTIPELNDATGVKITVSAQPEFLRKTGAKTIETDTLSCAAAAARIGYRNRTKSISARELKPTYLRPSAAEERANQSSGPQKTA